MKDHFYSGQTSSVAHLCFRSYVSLLLMQGWLAPAFSCSCHFHLTLCADLLFWKLVPPTWIHFSLLYLPWYRIYNVLSLSSSAIIYLRLLRTLLHLHCGEFSIFWSHLCTHQLHYSLSFWITFTLVRLLSGRYHYRYQSHQFKAYLLTSSFLMKDHFHLVFARLILLLSSGLAIVSSPASRPRARTCSHIIISLSTRDLFFSLYSLDLLLC